jgi:hypothetical protein
MEAVVYEKVTVDRCTSCQGIWFDAMECDQLMALPGGATLDSDCIWDRNPEGESPLADTPGGYKGTHCPHCQTKMNPAWLRRKKTRSAERLFSRNVGNVRDPTLMPVNSLISPVRKGLPV